MIPSAAIILGSGLGELIKEMDISHRIPYADIPHFPRATVKGHRGELLLGALGGKTVVVMAGRFHFYEGYSMREVTFPVRVMKALGAATLLISNAAGGMNPAFTVGSLMIVTDHINLQPEHPLRGENDERLGPRFPDLSEPYAKALVLKAQNIARKREISVHTGIYVGVPGPSFETRAEYRYLHAIGADAVGMSTVPEVIVAVHAGMQVFAMSVITDLGIREADNKISHEEVLAAAGEAAPRLTLIFRELVEQL
ncbi:purine-nucleoside phosphorylase [Compostibacter hankyongensis]|uniref:purine-nucleoside phosphorylase n=2 Tax=Compostibacter hankyongensis TaxID=1007089 RepID=A0ABP8FXZ0_9BACT